MNDTRVTLAVQGAGLIGRRHVAHIAAQDCAELVAIVDPQPAARDLAEAHGCAWYADFDAMLAHGRPDGIIIATPNQMHVPNGLACIAAGIPDLIEKPIAADLAGAITLVEAAETAGVALLVGHHRRHNPLIQQAQRTIASGALGRIVAVQAMCWFHKPASYFDVAWRREKGAGPVLVNMSHDIDLLRALCGDVVSVQAMASNAIRGNAVEETAVVLLQFASGALGSVTLSDTISAPWSWEFTSGENPDYTHTQESCLLIGGTLGSLSVPQLDLWTHTPEPDWSQPLGRERLEVTAENPLARQIRNFCGVIRGIEAPVVTGREGLETLRVIAAIQQAAGSGLAVRL